ncbi:MULTISPECIES: hypothetical protein [unclassified Paenibacillus]|uniref:hypothetical protein n=1 Tax=unclassified Paenibacillus TaxID=185978 RepID=UPI002405BD29|nr:MULTISPECIES: hypothetical protein [unclassified Paenibacillus]MDF9840897.1 hypothetical protein [Paenibacillus sp. PastF-2]MDF9847481.1 hypothetical protein [Paenibacillus sp. PastM-2]MDF9853942.1 hypothetical protein [Paenibacillus sp. PastF-1]MDH6479214.1 hypothetical protein [Paenibacillus sp. PastH-2]MDH6507050.1 hypothetical protein [Paenibacillus sp. PastM-3]
MSTKSKVLLYAAAGYVVAVLTSSFLPELISLLLPVAGAGAGLLGGTRTRVNLPAEVLPASQAPAAAASAARPTAGGPAGASAAPAAPSAPSARATVEPAALGEFASVVEYLVILEDMIISEGQKDTLDNEIVEKSLALFARLQRVIPLLQELGNGEINHTVRRLVMKDLNGVINPFLRLGGEAKTKNRRMLLNGLRDVDSKISEIASTIEHKDLMELQTKAELIHQRYSSSEL